MVCGNEAAPCRTLAIQAREYAGSRRYERSRNQEAVTSCVALRYDMGSRSMVVIPHYASLPVRLVCLPSLYMRQCKQQQ
jgi:hypothetical protein